MNVKRSIRILDFLKASITAVMRDFMPERLLYQAFQILVVAS